jgi:Domain of unknown function (DUF4337)
MVAQDVSVAEVDQTKARERWIGVYIGILAVLLAVCATGGGNASKDATLKNIEAANTWAFFQAKNMRRHVLRTQIDEFEVLLLSQPGMPETARSAIEAKIKQYKDQDKQLTSDPKTGEGLDELFVKGTRLQAERDIAMQRDPYFDYGQAFLQIAIVLASIAIISGGDLLLFGSALLGLLGLVTTVNGFTLAVQLPFIG